MEKLEKQQLKEMLQFRHEDAISRFTDLFNIDESEAEDIFSETMKFLYVSQIPGVFISDDLLIIDEMWHNLILFTPQYHAFSQTYFKEYFHHIPATKEEKNDRKKRLNYEPEIARQAYLERLQMLISVVYDHLGQETVQKWFQEYPVKYSKERLRALRK